MSAPRVPSAGATPRGVALVIVLSFVVLLTVAVVAFFSRVVSNRQTANSSFNGGQADGLARSALDVIVNDFKQEIVNGSTATTINGVTTYYPAANADGTYQRAGMVPLRDGNPAGSPDPIPNLIRRSVRQDGMTLPGVGSRASALNSATDAATNGRAVTPTRWNRHFLIPQKDATGGSAEPVAAFVAPDWVMMTKEEGPAVLKTPTADAGGNPVTVVGRYAYAVYDEGGLLDANIAGFPTGSSAEQIGGKGALACADLARIPLQAGAIDQLVGWRNYASGQPGGVFGHFTFDASAASRYFAAVAANPSGFLKVGTSVWQNGTDQVFLGRGQLIAFQQSLQRSSPGAFPAAALQCLGTFSRELNAPSWGPTANASDLGGADTDSNGRPSNYRTIRDADASYNRLLPGVRRASAGTVRSYAVDGTAFTYLVKAGDPLMQRRFSLGRLAWIGANGPQNGGTAENIAACFGLQWDGANGVWNYTAPGSAYNSPNPGAGDPANVPYRIKTLGEVAKETPGAPDNTLREPNFFELLAAGMLSGSLGLSPQDRSTATSDRLFYHETRPESWSDLNVFRVGAAILTQARAGRCDPVVIDYQRGNGDDAKAVGTDNLPYLNLFTVLSGVDPNADPASPALACYLLFGLWNPHQDNGLAARPSVRLCVQGQVTLANYYGTTTQGTVKYFSTTVPGYTLNVGAAQPDGVERIVLSDAGVNGFNDPHVPTASDVQGNGLTAGSAAGQTWATISAFPGVSYVGYRLPDFYYDPNRLGDPAGAQKFWTWLNFFANTNILAPEFNVWLEYQNPAGKWVPYTYFAGIKSGTSSVPQPTVWSGTSVPGFYAGCMGPYKTQTTPAAGLKASPKGINPPAGLDPNYYAHYPLSNSDPTTLRFNYTQSETTHSTAWTGLLSSSIWSSATEPQYLSGIGRIGTQNIPTIFTAPSWAPAGLARNNTSTTPGSGANFAAYKDPDGVTRLADSGLFTTAAASAPSNNWQGDPYALSTTRASDRPIMLHRLLNNVAELGYASRDYPWRTLDFLSDKSADSALLDLFTATRNTGRLAAGRISLNTRNVPALCAALSGTTANVLNPAGAGSTLPSDKAAALAAKLAAHTAATTDATAGPFINKDEIVTRFLPKLSQGQTISSTSDFNTLDDQNIKARREAVTRAFAEIGQTRTWNLLVDIVAQSGRYAPGATALRQFNVEGERHYWLHVAIDRFTGEVVDQQLEAVAE